MKETEREGGKEGSMQERGDGWRDWKRGRDRQRDTQRERHTEANIDTHR